MHTKLMQKDWREFGRSVFTFAVLEEVEKEGLKHREKFWIDRFQPEYNALGVRMRLGQEFHGEGLA